MPQLHLPDKTARHLSAWTGAVLVAAGAFALTAGVYARQNVGQDAMPFGAMGASVFPPEPPPVPLTVAQNKPGVPPTTAAGWRMLAEEMTRKEKYPDAASAYRKAADIYASKGLTETAKVMEIRAQRYETRFDLFYNRRAEPTNLGKYYTGKRLEPMYGAYIGAFIDREDRIQTTYTGFNGQVHRDAKEFNQRIGKRHAVFLTYQQYGSPFPDAWMGRLRQAGVAAQWALQPRSLEEVQDGEYLRGLATAAAECGIPIFLRFASEMNGSWVPYNGNPELYKEKFRLVARVFHELAPNVAMVWCPNEMPEAKIPDYYPGEDAVDWVGVNFYSVYYADNDPNRPNWWRNPSDSLDYIYQTYSASHPIMIGECAASFYSTADNQKRIDFARDKIGQLYSALPRRYPRIKAVHWFSMNTIKYAPPARRLNNYSLLTESEIVRQYQAMIASPYFLGAVKPGAAAREEITPLTSGARLAGDANISVYVKTYVQRPTVLYFVNGKQVHKSVRAGDHRIRLRTTALPDGPAAIGIKIVDDKGRLVGQETVKVTIANKKTVALANRP